MRSREERPVLSPPHKPAKLGLSFLWLRLVPDRPLSIFEGQAVAIGAIMIAGVARFAAAPVIGADVSFITAVPAVLLATLLGGRLAGLTTLLAGSALDLLYSIGIGGGTVADAAPRLLVWLCSAAFIMIVALGIRAALFALRAREQELVAASDQLELVIHELAHRGRNALAIVQALSSETARTVGSVSEYRERLGGRLAALAASYAGLTDRTAEPANLPALVGEVLAPFGGRISVEEGSDCRIAVKACVPLAMALHELATNATKYGSLSVPGGRVDLAWDVAHSNGIPRLRVEWREVNGPQVRKPARRGFGTRLIEQAGSGAGAGSGVVDLAFEADGLTCTIEVPLASRAEPARG